MIEIIRVEPKEIPELSAFASGIVKEHFDPIIGSKQNDYMIAQFQSIEGISKQMKDGYRYYWVKEDGKKAGFLAFYPREGKMYLSKFYVHKDFRGRHFAKKMFEFVKEETVKEHLPAVYLNVSKQNTETIAIYEHLGFQIVRKEKNPIGNGFYMDDYVLEYAMTE